MCGESRKPQCPQTSLCGSPPRLHPLLAATPHQWEGGTEKHFLEAGTPCRTQTDHFFPLWLGWWHLKAEWPEGGHGSELGLGGRKGGTWMAVMPLGVDLDVLEEKSEDQSGTVVSGDSKFMWTNNTHQVNEPVFLWKEHLVGFDFYVFMTVQCDMPFLGDRISVFFLICLLFFCASFPSPYLSTSSPFCLLSFPFISVTVASSC